MKDHAENHQVTNINMPRIGCGLDGLSWSAVRTLIKNVFKQSDISITVYNLEHNNEKQTTTIADMFKKGEKSKELSKSVIKSPKKEEKVDVGCGFATSKPLPDVFDDLKIHICDNVKDVNNLKRYSVAYGADVIEDHDLSEATHIVYNEKSDKIIKCNKTTKHVTRNWLNDSIKLKAVQDERLYRIKS